MDAKQCAECFGPLDFSSWRYPDGKVVCGRCRRDDGYLGPVSGGPADAPAVSKTVICRDCGEPCGLGFNAQELEGEILCSKCSNADSRELPDDRIEDRVEDLLEENAELRRQLATLERRLEYLEGWREGAIETIEAWRGGGER